MLKVVVPAAGTWRGREALYRAEAALREVEGRMSVWLGTSELSHFNAASTGEIVPLSGDTLALLHAAFRFTEDSQGAFDITCRPLLQLWRQAEELDREPSAIEMQEAMRKTGGRWIQFHSSGAEKLHPDVTIDLGGIGKGYAVDLAVAQMIESGVSGALVQCGGEIRVFGRTEHGKPWRIALQTPSVGEPPGALGTLLCSDLAVSTSGNYERYYTVQGRRRSHIVDPRTGIPVDTVPQVTVVAPSATVSDGWSTALSVLGPAGLQLLPSGVEALIVTIDGDQQGIHQTAGFAALLE
jgi:FAD:protein FMN transferase